MNDLAPRTLYDKDGKAYEVTVCNHWLTINGRCQYCLNQVASPFSIPKPPSPPVTKKGKQ